MLTEIFWLLLGLKYFREYCFFFDKVCRNGIFQHLSLLKYFHEHYFASQGVCALTTSKNDIFQQLLRSNFMFNLLGTLSDLLGTLSDLLRPLFSLPGTLSDLSETLFDLSEHCLTIAACFGDHPYSLLSSNLFNIPKHTFKR